MCVIVFKPVGVELPRKEILEACSRKNSDGMGYMVPLDGKVVGRKFLKLEELEAEVRQIHASRPVVLHFRLATHGGKGREDCHPFPFPFSKREDLFMTSWQAQMGVMHNGVLSGYGESCSMKYEAGVTEWDSDRRQYVYVDKTKETERRLSDTQEFLCYLAADRRLRSRVVNLDAPTLKLLDLATYDRWALMNGNGKVRRIGSWEQKDGVWYSNMYWESWVRKEPVVPASTAMQRWSGGFPAASGYGDEAWNLEQGLWVKRDGTGRKLAECSTDGVYVEFGGGVHSSGCQCGACKGEREAEQFQYGMMMG